jgi:hypothetical protein
MKFFVFFILLISYCSQAQIPGCTDAKAKNYNSKATVNDGSCLYNKNAIRLKNPIVLDKKIVETSGLIHWNNTLWTHNDDTDCNLYALDTLDGHIIETYNLPNITNTDWEEISQDENHIYIGDFGNNGQGNRLDLHILKVEKKSVLAHHPKIEIINFKYDEQIDFTKAKPNQTNFDCEAFLVTKDSIFLFTKEWIDKKTTVYVLPKNPGNYIAQKKESLNIGGLVTGVTYFESKKRVVFCGYTKRGKPFLYLCYDFKGNNFFSGNKRRLQLKPRFQQIEGISSEDGVHFYITNEHLKFLLINDPQKRQKIDLRDYFD